MLVAVMMMWSGGVIVARGAAEFMPPIGFSFWRWLLALLVLTPIAWPQVIEAWPFVRKNTWRLAALGFFMTGGSTLLIWSAQHTTATNIALVSATQPIVTALFAVLLSAEHLSGRQALGVVAALAGVVLMVVRMDLSVLTSLKFHLGDVLVLVAVMFYANYSVNLGRWIPKLSPIVMMFVTCLAGSLLLLPLCIVEGLTIGTVPLRLPAFAAIAFMAVIPSLLATTLWTQSVGIVGVNRASIFINLLPVFGIGLAVLLLGETLHNYHFIGGLLVCSGITLVVLGPSDRRQLPSSR